MHFNSWFFSDPGRNILFHSNFNFCLFLSFVGALFQPVRFSLLPMIVSKGQYIKANGTISLVHQVILTAGWGLSGVLLYLIPLETVIILAFSLFLLSGFVVIFMNLPDEESHKSISSKSKKAWKQIFNLPIVRTVTLMDFIEALANAIWSSAILLSFTIVILNQTEIWWGFLNASYFIGAIVGSIVVIGFSKIFENRMGLSIGFSALSMGVLTILFALSTYPILSVILCILMGPIYQVRDICQETILQSTIPVRDRVSIMAAKNAILTPWYGITYSVMGYIADLTNAQFVFILAGVLYLFTCVIAILQPSLRNYNHNKEVQDLSLKS